MNDDFEKLISPFAQELTSDAINGEMADALRAVREGMKVLSAAAGGVYLDAVENGLPEHLAEVLAVQVLNAALQGEA